MDFVTKIELTRTILVPRFSNLMRNSTIHFRMLLYLETCFLGVTVSLLCRSQGRTISSPKTNAATVVKMVAPWPVQHACHARDLGSKKV